MSEIKRLLNSLLWEIYGRIPSNISQKHTKNRYASMHSRIYEPRLLQKLNVKILNDICAILKLEIRLISRYLERVLISRDKNRTQQTILYGFLDIIVSSRIGESSREMRFNLSPPSGRAKGHGDADQSVIADEGNSSSDFNQWLHAMKMVARLPGGMPPEFRRKLWLALAEKYLKSKNVDWEKEEIKCFSEQWREDDVELGIQIVKDLHRTGSSLCSGPAGTINQAKLKRILLGYARYNPEVGYCQGFNMLGALILQVMDKEEIESIKVMIYLVEGILPRGYFSGSLGGLQADMAVFRELMTCKLPRLAKHLQKLQGPVENAYEPPLTNVFTMQWFLTMFCTCLPMTCVLRVWDLVLIEGSDVLLRTALVLWSLLEERILSAKTADDFYCKMGSFSSELLNGHLIDSNGLIEKVVDLGPIPELQKLRDKHLYNISPFRNKKGLQLYYSDEEGDSDEDSRMAVATAWGLRLSRRGSTGLSNKTDSKDRIALDISLLKKQYDRLRERQRQAHIILTSAVARQGSNPNQSTIQMNQLLIGRNAIVTNNGRRLGPPQGAIPPARRPHSTAKSPKPTHSKSTRHGETLHWRDTDLSRRRRGSVKWKDIKSDSSQSASGQEDRTSQLTGSAHSSRSSSSEPTSHRAPVKTHQRSDSSSYSEDSDGNSSTSTSLCDEDEHEAGDLNASSLEDSPIRKSKSNKKHSEVPHKKCLEDVLNSNEKQHTVDSQIPFIQLTTMESPVLNANKTDIDAIDYGKEDSETESSRLSYAGFVDEFNWTDLNEIRSAEPLKAITVDVTSNESDLLALTKTITSTSQLSPIPDITTYINNSSISPLRTPISAFDFTDTISSEDNSRQFNVNDEGVTNEYFERVNIVERPTKLDLLYSLNEEDSIRNAFLDKTPSYQSSPDRESSKETSSLESSQFLSSKSSTKNVPSTSQELDRKMKVLLEYSNQSSLSFIAEAKHELSLGKFKEKNPDLPSFNYQSPGFLSISDTEVKSFIKPVTTTSSEFDTITESSITGYSSLTGVENGETNLSPKEKETFMHTVGQEVATSSDLVDTVQPTEKSVPNIENRIPLTEDLEKRFEALEMSFQSRVKASINTQDPGIETGVTAESSTTEQESNDMSNPSEILKTPTESIKHAVSLRTTLEKQLEKTCEDKVSDKTSLHDTSQMETVELKEMSDTSDLMKTPWDSLTNEQSIKESTKDPQLSDLSNTKYIFDISPVDDKITVGDGTSIRNAYSFSTELQSSATGIMNKDKEQNSYSETECEKFEAQSQSFPTSPLQYSDDHFGHSEMETKCEGPSSTDKDTNNTVVCIEEMLNPTPVSSSSVTQSLPNYSENHFGDKGTSPPELEKQAKHQNTALTHPLDIHNDEKRICNATLKDDKTTKPANNETTDYEFKFKPLEKQISEKLLSISKVSEMELKNEIPTGLKTEKVVKGPDIIINNDIKPRINISESLPVSTALEEKSMKHIPSTADLEHRFRELERKLSSPNLTSSTKQADAKTMTSPLSTGPHLILSVVKTTSDNTTDDKANEQPPSIRKRIPSTEDLETRFNALEIEKALKSPVSGPSNLLSPLQAKNDIFVSHQTTAVSVMNKKPDIPSTEDLEQRFQALEQSKLVQKTHSDDKGDVMRSRSTKAELITEPAVSTKDTFSQDGKETQLIPIAVKETKVDSSSRANKILPTTQDLEARFEQLTQKKSITKHLTQSPETPTITIENKSQVVKSSVTNIKTTRFGEQTTSSMEHEDSKEVTPIIPPLIIEHKKEEADCIPIALEKKIYSGITDKEHKKREPDHTATPFESKVINLPEPDFTPKLLDLKISSPIELEQQSNPGLDPIEHEDKKLEPEYISQSADFKMIMSKPTTLGDQELLKANDSAHSPTEIDSIATSPVTALKVNKIQEEECLTDESTPIVEQQKRKDLYKIESQSDETLTIGDQTNTEFDPRAESRPTSCPEYRDPFDVNVITTDRVLKIIEENSKILHRILKKTLADSGDMENNAQPSKTINPSQIADSLSVLGNSIPSNTDSISPSRIISHSWLRSSFTLRSDDNISDRLASIKNTIKSIDTLCEEKSFRKEKCQRYIDSLFASPSKTIETPANPLIKVDDFENQPSQERTSKRELKKDISPRRRRNDDREEYESRVRRDMMPNSVDTCSDHSLSSIGNIDQVDREVDSINEGIEAGPQAQRPLSPYYGSGYDLYKRSITPVVYIPTKLEIRHTTVTSTFYDRYLTEKQIEKTFPKSKRSPMSPTLTKSYLEISSYSTTSTLNNQSSKSAENSPSRRRTAGAISPNDPVATANNKRNLLSTLDNATSDLHIRSCDNILLQMKSTTNNNKDYNPLPVKLRKPPEVAINLGLYKDYSSNESSKS